MALPKLLRPVSAGAADARRAPSPNRRIVGYDGVAIIVIVLLAAALRLYDLDRTSLWLDEAISWEQSHLSFLEMISVTAQDNHPPLHNLILHFVIRNFGDTETLLRLPSAILGIANVFLICRLGTVLWDRMTGLLASLLLALSGFHIWYSTEARMYALFTFASTLFVLAAIHALRRPSWVTLAGYVAAATILLHSHPYGSFVYVSLNIVAISALMTRRKWVSASWLQWLSVQFVTLTIFFPWAIILFGRARVVMAGFWIPKPSPDFVFRQLQDLAGGLPSLVTIGLASTLSFVRISAFGASPSVTTLREALERILHSAWRLDWQTAVVVVWVVAPALLGYLVSIIAQPIFLSRYLICVLPAFLLLAARGIRSLFFNYLVATAAIAVILWNAVPPAIQAGIAGKNRPDHRALALDFAKLYSPAETVMFYQPWTLSPFRYYYRETVSDEQPIWNLDNIGSSMRVSDRFWLVVTYSSDEDLARLLATANESHTSTFSRQYAEGVRLYAFSRRP